MLWFFLLSCLSYHLHNRMSFTERMDKQTDQWTNKASYNCEDASENGLNTVIPKLHIFSDTQFTMAHGRLQTTKAC